MKQTESKAAAERVWKVSEIAGFEVFDRTGEKLGVLADVISTGSNDVWVVKDDGDEVLIPALKSIIREVNKLRKKIFVSLPEGYRDIYARTNLSENDLEYNGCLVYED
ncbi:MAG: PRC-barrel domain-containing protein [Endomicrobium sp.]|jgi:16S rRNA processing protein RimM|nr:PRC-barrel domain-containing protein [Endomicrobium sp.]